MRLALPRTILIALLPLLPAAAVAADEPHFIITVPVRLDNLPPEINALEVHCEVGPNATHTPQPLPAYGASGNAIVPVANGRVNAEVQVRIRSSNVRMDPATARNYDCRWNLGGVLGGVAQGIDVPYAAWTVRPPFNVSGTIPR